MRGGQTLIFVQSTACNDCEPLRQLNDK